MFTKSWNDRADRDLFFTILSIKCIGIITGPEWTSIGNSMRSMGYGFTNEGCRQHFQGLRRAQHTTRAYATEHIHAYNTVKMVNWEDADLRDALLVGFWNTFKEHFSQETKDQIMAAAQKHDSTINWNNFRCHTSTKMVNWDNAELALRIVTYLWNTSKDKFTPEFKENMIFELKKVDATITWEALR
ncbi:hypothetical protein HYQ44_000027 [Verticillium longisporum]|nr:hypothetical protein HYQ44_000027 [Verticillium longisporum]